MIQFTLFHGRKVMRRPACARSFWPLLVLCAGIGGGAAAENRSLQGTFVNEQQSEKTVEAAIETAVSKMNFIKRPIARSRLKKTNDAHRRVEIALGQTEIGIAFDGRAPVEMPADGRTIRWKREDGETFDVNAVWDGDRLVQTFKAEDGTRTNAFALGADGKLNLQVTLTSPQLEAPVVYTLTFDPVPR
jgi:hypothetical protein